MRGVQIIGWSVRMALMACFTQNSGFRGGRKGSISFLNMEGGGEVDGGKKSVSVEITGNVGTYFSRLKTPKQLNEAMLQMLLQIKNFIQDEIKRSKKKRVRKGNGEHLAYALT